ncbi:MAG: TonB-dependent receptor, partial [Gammaproteobacteria bacterium]|nr:TonB-dependent receptor [Gammaproteobacteria bacterium]
MRERRLRRVLLPVAAAASAAGAVAVTGAPADNDDNADQLVEVVVSVGTRVRTRTAADTAVPVDVFNREQVESINSSDLVDVLNAIVPSFSVRREPVSDGASFIRP